jgi:hypothetical protein
MAARDNAPANRQIPQFSPARSILLLKGVNPDFNEDRLDIARNLWVGRITEGFVDQLVAAGLTDAPHLADGLSVYIEFAGTTSTADLMYPQRLATALAISSDLAVHGAVHIIADLGEPGSIVGTPLPPTDWFVHWGHRPNALTRESITGAVALEAGIKKVQLTDRYHRVGNALLFYMNGYNSDNPDLALIAFTTCLEGLFSTVEQEISFRLALRLAHFLGESRDDQRSKFEQCREVYKVRSKVVHGAPVLRGSEAAAIYLVETIVPEAEKLARTALRKIFALHLETLFDQPNKVEALFEELLFEESLERALAKIG